MDSTTTVLLVDDHPVFRKGLRMLLEDESDFSVVGEAGDGEQAIDKIRELTPDIVILDITMPGLNGIEVAQFIAGDYSDTKVVALSIHSEKRFVEDMLLAGAAGYILKQTAPEDLVNGIRTVMQGESFLSPSITSVVLSQLLPATSAEQVPEPADGGVISTKFYPPPVPDYYVTRRDLNGFLEKIIKVPIALVITPAGYGKSVCISSWLKEQSMPYSWITLDESENDLRQFLFYLLHAIQNLFPGSLADCKILACSANLPPIHSIAECFIREVEKIETDFVIALDDIHHVGNKAIYDFLSEVLRHPSPHFHLVVIGRRDPFLPISRLRGKDMVLEIRVREMCFDREETRQLIELILGIRATTETVRFMHQRTEGWIAGLRMLLFSSNGISGQSSKPEELSSDSQIVQEFLLTEVLENQPVELSMNLMRLALLDRFCAPLCEVIGAASRGAEPLNVSGEEFIRTVKSANLFLITLDAGNIWYRFHHMFQQLLLTQLRNTHTVEQINTLHIAVSDWFSKSGLHEEAIKHAILGGRSDRAEALVKQHRHLELEQDRGSAVERWLMMFPSEVRLQSPPLLLAMAYVCLDRYQMQEAAALVERLDMLAATAPLKGPALGELHYLKGALSYWLADSRGSLEHISAASKLLPKSYRYNRGMVAMYRALAQQMEGSNALACDTIKLEVIKAGSGAAIYRSRLIASLSFLHYIGGDLHQANEAANRLLAVSSQKRFVYTMTWGHYMLGNIALQLFDISTAINHLAPLENQVYVMHSRAAADSLAGLALSLAFQKEADRAFLVSKTLIAFAEQSQDAHLLSVAHSLKARLFLLNGNIDGAETSIRSIEEQDSLPALFTWLELPALTRCRVLINMGSSSSLVMAGEELNKLKARIIKVNNDCHLIETMVLEALLLSCTEGDQAAETILDRVLDMAAERGWIRPFIEAGRPLLKMLDHLSPTTEAAGRHKERILQISATIPRSPAVKIQPSVELAEPLTSRESEILELLAERLQNKEIGEKLFISPETVKSHIKRLFSKLDAVNRRDVVTKAFELGLLKKQ